MKKTNRTGSKELLPLKFHTSLVKKDIPLFEENLQRLTPFFFSYDARIMPSSSLDLMKMRSGYLPRFKLQMV